MFLTFCIICGAMTFEHIYSNFICAGNICAYLVNVTYLLNILYIWKFAREFYFRE